MTQARLGQIMLGLPSAQVARLNHAVSARLIVTRLFL